MSGAILADGPVHAPAVVPARPNAALTARMVLVAMCVLVGVRGVALLSAVPTADSERVPAYFADGERYLRIASSAGTPYRDFEVEYPPATLAFVEVVVRGDVRDTLRNIGVASFALDLLTAAALAYGFGRRAALAYLALSAPFFLLPFVYFRVDFFVVALTAWGIALVRRRHDAGAGALLAVAVFAKLWPLVLLPLLLVEQRRRAIVSVVACGVAGAVGWLLLGGTAGIEQVLTFRGARGFQIESVAGGVMRSLSGETPRIESGALRVGDVAFGFTLLLGGVMVAGIACVWTAVYRRRDASVGVVYGVAPVVAVTIFMACAPLLSPQFLLWLLPFAAIAWAHDEHVLGGLVGLAVLLTMLLTQAYGPLNDDLLVGHLALAARNGTLVAIVVVGARRLLAASPVGTCKTVAA